MPWANDHKRWSQMPADWQAIRRQVFDRDHHQCQIRGPRCNGNVNQVDHIRDGNDHTLSNLRSACPPCHSDRTASQGHDAMRALREQARHPREMHPGLS